MLMNWYLFFLVPLPCRLLLRRYVIFSGTIGEPNTFLIANSYIHTVVCNRLMFFLWNILPEIQLNLISLVLLISALFYLAYFQFFIFLSIFHHIQPSRNVELILATLLCSFFFSFFWGGEGGGLGLPISLLSILHLHLVFILPTVSGNHSKASLLWIHGKCSVSWK